MIYFEQITWFLYAKFIDLYLAHPTLGKPCL